ncbi:hypothetical protein GCM10025786_35700 [Nocardioides caeni]
MVETLAWTGTAPSAVRPETARATPREPNRNCFEERIDLLPSRGREKQEPRREPERRHGGKGPDPKPRTLLSDKVLGKTHATIR